MDEALRRMYEEATDGEASILDDLRHRAGLVWTCDGPHASECGWDNAEFEPCELCGRPAPDPLSET